MPSTGRWMPAVSTGLSSILRSLTMTGAVRNGQVGGPSGLDHRQPRQQEGTEPLLAKAVQRHQGLASAARHYPSSPAQLESGSLSSPNLASNIRRRGNPVFARHQQQVQDRQE